MQSRTRVLFDVIASYAETATDRQALQRWQEGLVRPDLILLVHTLLDGLTDNRWPWTGAVKLCGAFQTEWGSDKRGRPGRRLYLTSCTLPDRHPGGHAFGKSSP